MESVNGDADDIDHFYKRHRQRLFTYALSITCCPGAAEDAIQDAFCRIYRKQRIEGNMKAYIFRAVRNAAFNQVRRNSKSIHRCDAYVFANGHDPAANGEQRELSHRVADALHELSGDERETIVQHLFGGLAFREIAELRRDPLGSVTSWYRRGLAKLKHLLGEEE